MQYYKQYRSMCSYLAEKAACGEIRECSPINNCYDLNGPDALDGLDAPDMTRITRWNLTIYVSRLVHQFTSHVSRKCWI